MFKKIAVLGAGAIGSSVAADIAKAGHDLTVIDQWPAHIEAMKANGLRVTVPDEDIHVKVDAVHLCDVAALNRTFDLVLMSAKSYDAEWMARFIAPHLAADGVLVPVMNSIHTMPASAAGSAAMMMSASIQLWKFTTMSS